MSKEENEKNGKARRRIMVPGESVEVTVVVRDNASNMVLAIPSGTGVVILFVSNKPHARVMSNGEANEFTKSIRDAYQSFQDDAVVKEMEKEFGND